jgi:hypothetical protein
MRRQQSKKLLVSPTHPTRYTIPLVRCRRIRGFHVSGKFRSAGFAVTGFTRSYMPSRLSPLTQCYYFFTWQHCFDSSQKISALIDSLRSAGFAVTGFTRSYLRSRLSPLTQCYFSFAW